MNTEIESSEGFADVHLQDKGIIWPWLLFMRHIRSNAVEADLHTGLGRYGRGDMGARGHARFFQTHRWASTTTVSPSLSLFLFPDTLSQDARRSHCTVVSSEENLLYIKVRGVTRTTERKFFIDNLLVRTHLIIEIISWTGLAPWEYEFLFPGSLIPTFLDKDHILLSRFSSTSPAFHLRPSTLNPHTQTLTPQPSTLNPHSSTLNPQPSPLNPQPSTLRCELITCSVDNCTCGDGSVNPADGTATGLNPQPTPYTLNPSP